MIVNGIDIAGMVLVVALVFAAVEYREWRNRDEDRRIARLRKRNLA